jgi:hypothetical protein
MTRKRAKSVDRQSFWAVGMAKTPGELRRPPPMASPQTGGMLAFVPFQGSIWGMSAN